MTALINAIAKPVFIEGELAWTKQDRHQETQRARFSLENAREILRVLRSQIDADNPARYSLKDVDDVITQYWTFCQELHLATGIGRSNAEHATGEERVTKALKALDSIAWMARQHRQGLHRSLDDLGREPFRPGWQLDAEPQANHND